MITASTEFASSAAPAVRASERTNCEGARSDTTCRSSAMVVTRLNHASTTGASSLIRPTPTSGPNFRLPISRTRAAPRASLPRDRKRTVAAAVDLVQENQGLVQGHRADGVLQQQGRSFRRETRQRRTPAPVVAEEGESCQVVDALTAKASRRRRRHFVGVVREFAGVHLPIHLRRSGEVGHRGSPRFQRCEVRASCTRRESCPCRRTDPGPWTPDRRQDARGSRGPDAAERTGRSDTSRARPCRWAATCWDRPTPAGLRGWPPAAPFGRLSELCGWQGSGRHARQRNRTRLRAPWAGTRPLPGNCRLTGA